MANETLKAGFDKYMAGVEAKLAKNPERANLEPNRLYIIFCTNPILTTLALYIHSECNLPLS